MGRKFFWVTEVTGFEPERLLTMRFVEGPLSGHVYYEIVPDGPVSIVRIRNAADASFKMPGMSWMLRRSVRGDLLRLKTLVEHT